MKKKRQALIALLLVVVVVVGFTLFMIFGTAGGKRWQKNLQSNFGDGLKREITVYNADGSIIYAETGKFDINYSDSRLEYIDSETGLKTNIYIGYNATVVVNELE